MKPKVTYEQFKAVMSKRPTVAQLIERYELENGARIGRSQSYTFGMLKRSPTVGERQAHEMTAMDVVEHVRRRLRDGAKPQTCKQDVTYLRVVFRDAEMLWEIPGVTLHTLAKAHVTLTKQGLICSSQRRTQRPTPEQQQALLSYFRAEDPRCETKMAIVYEFQLASGRRISETCRITRGGVNLEKRTCEVRDLKNSKGKGFHGTFPLLGRAWEIVLERLAVIPDHPGARLFPFNEKTCGHRHTDAKKALGFGDLRMHDARRERFSGMLEAGYSVAQVQQVSLHTDANILLKNYVTTDAAAVHAGPVGTAR